MLVRVVLLVLLALGALACGGRFTRGGVRGPDRRALVRLERQAQQQMRCRAPLQVVALEARAYQLSGCGQVREYAWTCAGRHCVFQPMVAAIFRASEDLQCAPEQIASQADSATHRSFFGCSRGIAYVLLCVDHGCTWSRTPETVAMAGAPPPTAAVVASPTYRAPIADPSLDDAVIPPPPGAPSAFGSTAQSPLPPPPPSAVPPPPASSAPPPPTSDTVVIPPPPS